ncbi:hypothetical protein [uncultured Ruegeria sp.]|uniref:hypothetical protein n=1 Tax=uncultured Ruegeria sp. TaxID=259304 RepID=UPI00260D71E6|nr:hypothetical protein [uncultured Ruegeria sp.]
MHSSPSVADIEFKDRFETGRVPLSEFSHREHLQLAFVYLCETGGDNAHERMQNSLKDFLQANNVPDGKYHETLTQSWLRAVKYFMSRSQGAVSFEDFIAADDRLLDTNIMLTHYRRETLFSEKARSEYVAPDLQPIPMVA